MTEVVRAHGLGGAADLPIPLSYALIGGSWALTFSVAILFLFWRTPRLRPDAPGRPLPAGLRRVIDARGTRIAVAAISVAATVGLLVGAGLGPSDAQRNPVPGIVYIYVWVGVMMASMALGPVWKFLSPPRALHRLSGHGAGRLRYPDSWGLWPGAAGLFSFAWLELASPEPSSVVAVAVWVLGYLVVSTGGLLLFGPIWAERADPLEVYSSLLGRLSPLARDGNGDFVLRSPLHNLAGTPALPGSAAVAATLLGSTLFDSFSASPAWRALADGVGEGAALATLVRTVGLFTFITVVYLVFRTAARAAGGLEPSERAQLPNRLAHSLTPIVAGYLIAHYLTFLVEKGQATLGLEVRYVLSTHPALLGSIKVLAVLTGHILGVAAAHDRSLRLLSPAHRLTGQLALMLAMVAITFSGLYLLFEA
ncbi:hypothetical protein NDR87_11000 [Nocardia sp. CDC159]|uniref:Fenitrothion hydrolase n=1 Tax=Nocardia pulmonis TaxID=2951408 RepID=A0A9X2E4C4_9NOCA|nr:MULTISPECIES: hypothetical protein [Nocardia]MCM6773999.1 hypothetical protein [Nocardia pulmonis]MCM6786886.1 hypothetical protein [Nocardia sp. CDC159]